MNFIDYLEDKGISYSDSGENVTEGWINLPCLFCSDTKNHLGINLENLYANCWICGGHSITEIVKEIEDCTWNKAKKIVGKFGGEYRNEDKKLQREKTKEIYRVSLPNTSSKDFPKLYLNYLKKRRYNPQYLINKYQLECCKDVGKYKYRIIVPFYLNNKLVTFSSVDVTGRSDVKYLHQPKREAVRFVNQTLYNIDTVKDMAIIVEGLFDVWRIGDGWRWNGRDKTEIN